MSDIVKKANYKLNEQQIQHFETFGFLVRRQVFRPEEIDKLNEEFGPRLATVKHELDQKTQWVPKWPSIPIRNPQTPLMTGLLEDPRIYMPLEQLHGENPIPVYSNANSLTKNTAWHPDAMHRHLLVTNNLIYLQPITGNHGSLRVIPGSHKSPLFDELTRIRLMKPNNDEPDFLEESGMRGEDIPSFLLYQKPGDVITWNQRLWHAAFGGDEGRRNISISFFSNPKTSQEENDLHALIKKTKINTNKPKYRLMNYLRPYYHPWWLANLENSALRVYWIKKLEEWGFIEAMNN